MLIPAKNNLTFLERPDIWLVGGLDEAHYSGAAGSMWVGYVVARADTDWKFVNDSKLLTTIQLYVAYDEILNKAVDYLAYEIPVPTLDELEEGESIKMILRTMKKCVKVCRKKPDFLFIDAHVLDGIRTPQFGPIGGDRRYKIIGAASCIAKVHNVNEMADLALKYPEYDFINNRGYYTKKHHDAVMKYGLIPGVHRKNWCHTWERRGARWRT